MYNVSTLSHLKSTPLPQDPFLKISPLGTQPTTQSHQNRLHPIPFIPAPRQEPMFDYHSTVRTVTEPINETYESKMLKHPETEPTSESYTRRVINLRNDLKWYDREFHAMNLEGRLDEERIRDVLNHLDELKRAAQRRDPSETHEKNMTALEALRAQEAELRAEYKRYRHARLNGAVEQVTERPRTAPASRLKKEKWWEWTTPEFTKRLHQNTIDIATGRTPKVHPPLPRRSQMYARHSQPWRPQYKCPQNFDSAPHPMFGQDYPPYKRKFAGEIEY